LFETCSVLINTAGFLQTQAESTGQESTEQVSNNIDVVSATGGVEDISGLGVASVTFLLDLGPGAEPVDIENAAIEYLGPGGPDRAEISDSRASIDLSFVDGGGAPYILESDGSMVELTVNLVESGDGGAVAGVFSGTDAFLSAGETAQFTIETADGAQRVVEVDVPSPLDAEGGDDIAV